jgi:hypothetical protein
VQVLSGVTPLPPAHQECAAEKQPHTATITTTTGRQRFRVFFFWHSLRRSGTDSLADVRRDTRKGTTSATAATAKTNVQRKHTIDRRRRVRKEIK